jgi:acyl carrier protein
MRLMVREGVVATRTEAFQRAETAVRESLCDVLGKQVLNEREKRSFEGGLGLDSIGFLELILGIENRLGLRVRSEDLSGDAVGSVDGLVRHIAATLTREAEPAQKE